MIDKGLIAGSRLINSKFEFSLDRCISAVLHLVNTNLVSPEWATAVIQTGRAIDHVMEEIHPSGVVVRTMLAER